MEPRVDLDQICLELPRLACSRVNLWRGLRNEAPEGHATLTAGACVRASAQWPLTNGTPGAVPGGRISQARPHFGRSRRSLFKTYETLRSRNFCGALLRLRTLTPPISGVRQFCTSVRFLGPRPHR